MLRFIDGFDHYATADFAKKWTSFTNDSTRMTIAAGTGRRSTAALRVDGLAGFSNNLVKILPTHTTWIFGFAFNPTSAPTISDAYFMSFWDAANGFQGELRLNNTGTISVMRTPTVLGTTSTSVPFAAWSYFEYRVVVHNSTGQVEIRLNGTTALSLTNQDTQASSLAEISQFRLGNVAGKALGVISYDDLYVCDGSGSVPDNGFLGDCRVDTLWPNAEGATQQWTPSTGTAHSPLVDDATPNTTDYVSSFTATQRELFGMQDLSTMTGTIYGVQLALAVLKSDAGARSMTSVIRSGASEALGPAVALSTSQLYTLQVQTTDPATSAAWTESGVNSVQAGAEVA